MPGVAWRSSLEMPQQAVKMYAVSSGCPGEYPAYLTGAYPNVGRNTWADSLDRARMFPTQESALEFVGNYTVALGKALTPTAKIVRVDLTTRTVTERVATTLK